MGAVALRVTTDILPGTIDQVDAVRRVEQQLELAIAETVHLVHLAQDRAVELVAPLRSTCTAQQMDAVRCILYEHLPGAIGVVPDDVRSARRGCG